MNKKLIENRAPEILSEIKRSSNILLHCHVNPDQDSYGSALAMYHALKQLGKNVTVIKGDNDLLSYLSPLPGYNNIVEKNYFEIDTDEFDLFIVLDSTQPYRISRKGKVIFPKTMKTIGIDHHDSKGSDHALSLVLPNAPSTTSILYHLFKLWNVGIDEEIATCLLIGLYGDTNNFANSATTPETFSIAADLTENHPKALETINTIQHNDDKRVLLLTQKALESLQMFFDERVAIIQVPCETFSEYNLRQEDVERAMLSDKLVTTRNWDIVVSMLEEKPKQIRISFRTNKTELYNVADIADSLGGGGHEAASGVIFENTTLDEARDKILNAIETTFGN